jgi:hypothetical protein
VKHIFRSRLLRHDGDPNNFRSDDFNLITLPSRHDIAEKTESNDVVFIVEHCSLIILN